MLRHLPEVRFLKSATHVSQLGVCHAEIALVGRSNVGKSSLLNSLADHRQLARVSRTPGRTRLINVFVAGPDRWIVDLPGYGYASGSARERSAWKDMLEGYLTLRDTLRVVLVLVDAEVGPTKLDHQMLEWLQAIDRPYRVVATKADRVKPSLQARRRRELAAALGLKPDDVAWVSSAKGTGIAELQREVAALLNLA